MFAGEHKVEGHPFAPLEDEARAEMQRSVDSYHRDFLADAARGRNTTMSNVRENFGRGRLLRATAAKAAGMVDGIGTLNDMLAGRGTKSGRTLALQLDLAVAQAEPMTKQRLAGLRLERALEEAEAN